MCARKSLRINGFPDSCGSRREHLPPRGATRRLRHAALAALMLWCLCGASVAQTAQDDALQTLQTYLETHPASRVLEGLCALPETAPTYAAALGNGAEPECSIPEALPPQLHERLVERLAERLRAMPAAEQRRFFVRLGHWVTAQRELDILAELTSSEQLMGAAFQVPATRALFEQALRARGLDPRGVDPLTAGASLAAAEHEAIRREVATLISARPLADQLAYYRDLFEAVRGLLADEAGNGSPSP